MGNDSKAFSNRTILKIISKIGTYSYCTPLLICVGGCATVLVVWLPIILFECVAQLVEHSTFNRRVVGSNPSTLINFCYIAGNKLKDVNYYN